LPLGFSPATLAAVSEARVVDFYGEGMQVLLSYEPMDEDVGTLVVQTRAEGLVYEFDVESARGDGLDAFLAGLADEWKGWHGIRHWETVWCELNIDATHRGRIVEFLFTSRAPYRGSEPGDPDVELRMRIEVVPGEALSKLAGAASRLVAPSP
jgi:hypothetical protein